MKFSGLSEYQEQRLQTALKNVPFARLVGIELESAEPGSATMTLQVREELLQNNRVVHGGAIASLIDSVTAFAVIPLLKEDETATTVDLTITYVRPLTEGVVRSTAKVLRAGNRIVALSAEVFDHTGNLAATALTTYLRMTRR
ncbi:MAG TPA: PaaI family thioesterase [Pyrinomonadaceae bacterium]